MEIKITGKPIIVRCTDYESRETVQLFGDNFDVKGKLYWWRPEFDGSKTIEGCGKPIGTAIPELPPEDAVCYNIDEVVDGNVLYISASKDVRGGAAIVWVENELGFSKPFVVNRPTIYSKSVTKIYQGGIVNLFGCNFETKNYIYFKNIKTGEFIPGEYLILCEPGYNFYVHKYNASVRVPNDIPDGEYEIYINSGFGGEFAWSEPVTVKVEREYSLIEYFATRWNRDAGDDIAMPECAIKAVPANILGANIDMWEEIQSAIDELAENGGGIVMLSAGTYGISQTINIKPGVVLQGAGMGATTIKSTACRPFTQSWDDVVFARSFTKRAYDENKCSEKSVVASPIDWKPHWFKRNKLAALVRICGAGGIEQLRLELCDTNMGVLIANTEEEVIENAFVNYVDIDGGAVNTYSNGEFGRFMCGLVCIADTENLSVFKCNMVAPAPIHMLPSRNMYAKIIGNKFISNPRQVEQPYFCGLMNSMICQNDITGGRRGLMFQGYFDNTWVYQNRTTDVARSGNALEVYMSERGDADWTGKASAVGENYIEVADLETTVRTSEDYKYLLMDEPRYICVMNGKGFGQLRKVAAFEGNRIYLDKPWEVLPDLNTAFSLVIGSVRNMWVDNNAALLNGHSQFLWNCGFENIMAGHYIDIAAGIRIYSCSYYLDGARTCAVAFNRIEHCQIRGCGEGIWLDSDGYRISDKKPDYILATGGGMFGNSVRRNVIDGMNSMPYTKNLGAWVNYVPNAAIALGGAYNTVCTNRIGGCSNGIKLLDNTKGNCIENTTFYSVNVPISGLGDPIGNDVRDSNYYGK